MKNIILIILFIIICFQCLKSQIKNDSTLFPKDNISKFSVAFLPAMTTPMNKNIGYGFNINSSYKLIEDIKISGNIEVIFFNIKINNVFGERTSEAFLISLEIGPKFYLNRGTSRIYLNTHFKFTHIFYETNHNYYLSDEPDIKLGFNLGFGFEIPVTDQLNFEVNPTLNVLYKLKNERYLPSEFGYYKILVGLNYNL